MHKNVEDYLMILNAEHIAEILMISKPTAYELMEQTSFPLILIAFTGTGVWLIEEGVRGQNESRSLAYLN